MATASSSQAPTATVQRTIDVEHENWLYFCVAPNGETGYNYNDNNKNKLTAISIATGNKVVLHTEQPRVGDIFCRDLHCLVESGITKVLALFKKCSEQTRWFVIIYRINESGALIEEQKNFNLSELPDNCHWYGRFLTNRNNLHAVLYWSSGNQTHFMFINLPDGSAAEEKTVLGEWRRPFIWQDNLYWIPARPQYNRLLMCRTDGTDAHEVPMGGSESVKNYGYWSEPVITSGGTILFYLRKYATENYALAICDVQGKMWRTVELNLGSHYVVCSSTGLRVLRGNRLALFGRCFNPECDQRRVHHIHIISLEGISSPAVALPSLQNDQGKLQAQIQLAKDIGCDDTVIAEVFKNGPYPSDREVTRAIVQAERARSKKRSKKGQQAQAYALCTAQLSAGVLDDLRVEVVIKDSRCLLELEPTFAHIYQPSKSQQRGVALIISNRHFTTLSERVGTDVDAANAKNLFEQLGYKVKAKQDLSAEEMMRAVVRYSLHSQHSTADSAVVVVMTHGRLGKLYGSDSQTVAIDALMETLNQRHCPALKGKPKIFILQACRGGKKDEGDFPDEEETSSEDDDLSDIIAETVPGTSAGTVRPKVTDEVSRLSNLLHHFVHLDECDARKIGKLPITADFLIAYSTTPGYVSWRDRVAGSWFVQSLCQVFAEHSKDEDIAGLLTRVSNQVALKFDTKKGKLQMPQYESQLLKKFYFFPGYAKQKHLWKAGIP